MKAFNKMTKRKSKSKGVEPPIAEFIEKYGPNHPLPFDLLVNHLTMGDLYLFYTNLKQTHTEKRNCKNLCKLCVIIMNM